MSFLRPEVAAALHRWHEVLSAGALSLAGLWLVWLGGWLLVPVGGLVLGTGAVWAVLALRRLRFGRGGDAPGVVDVIEGQVSYFGPEGGGFAALEDLAELRLVALGGRRHWRLAQTDGQVLLIPVGAARAERLFDAFATLPGMDMQVLLAALDAPPGPPVPAGGLVVVQDGRLSGPVVWRRPSRAALA